MPDAPPPERPPPLAESLSGGYPPPGWGQPPPHQYPPPPAPPAPPWGYPPSGYPPPGWAPAPGPSQVGSGRFRSMGVGELLDATFSMYRRNFVLIAAISAVVQVPFAVAAYVLYRIFDYTGLQATLTRLVARTELGPLPPDQRNLLLSTLGGLVVLIGLVLLLEILLVLPLAEAATTRAVSDRYLDRDTSVGTSYLAAVRRLVPLVVQSLILLLGAVALFGAVFGVAAVSAGVGILLLLGAAVFAIFVFVRTSLAPPAIVLESLSGPRGLARSWNLVRGLSWRMLGIRLLLLLITVIINGVFVLLITLPGSGLDANGRLLLNQVASAVAAVFVGPLTYIGVTLLYYDARIRKEGFDIEMLAQSL